ncbi:hypothetical protein GCM10022267_00380 [Lentzea roselyniae]|uniref:Uncharacterized protein n=1 Tax=Lentzea roselyniae TaxID=531940 RepID=A0ABP6ZUK7_9PSEU
MTSARIPGDLSSVMVTALKPALREVDAGEVRELRTARTRSKSCPCQLTGAPSRRCRAITLVIDSRISDSVSWYHSDSSEVEPGRRCRRKAERCPQKHGGRRKDGWTDQHNQADVLSD